MSASGQFYNAQAATCAANATKATLDNERDKYLRAQAAWEALATRENETQVARLKREADKLTSQEELS